MSEWKEYKLEEIINFNPKEKLPKGSISRKIGMELLIPYCREVFSNNFEPYKGGAKFRNGDTIMARITPCLENGKIAKISNLAENEIAFGSTEYIVCRAKENISDADYIYYLICSPRIRNLAIKSMVGSSGRQRVQQDVLNNYIIQVPKLEEQQKIAAILSSLDDKIAVNRKISDNLEQQAQALFKSWFVDFEPFKDGEFEESELGRIPKGWKVGTLGDILKLKRDSIKKENKGKLPYLPIDIIPMHHLGIDRFGNSEDAQSSLQKFSVNDIVIGAMRVYFHRVIIAPCDGITRNTCFVLEPQDKDYLYYSLLQCNQNETISYANRTSKGSTMPYAVWKGALENYKILIPDFTTIHNFNKIVSPLIACIRDSYKEIRTLSQLRDTLLPKLMSGELKVNEI